MARNKLVWLVCLSILSVLPAGAAFQTYTTLEGWLAAATQSGVTIDFSSLNLTAGSSSLLLSTMTIGGVDFTSPSDQVQVHYGYPGGDWNWGTAAILHNGNDVRPLKAAWTTPVTAFATLMGINRANGPWLTSQMDVKVWNGVTKLDGWVPVTSAHPTLTFFGIVATEGETFNSVTFTPADTQYVSYSFLDDVRLGAYNAPAPPVGETPELGTGLLSLCGGILLAAGGFRRHLKTS